MKKRTDLKGQHSFILFLLCLYVVDSATFLASNRVLGTLFSTENSLFITYVKKIKISEFILLL